MRKIYFITGAGRCGTKLLASFLDGNKQIHVFPKEVTNFFSDSLERNGLSKKVYKHSFKRLLDNFFQEIKSSNIHRKNKIIKAINNQIKKRLRYKNYINLENFLNIILDNFYQTNKPVVINVHDENFLGLLETFPSCKILHMIRNPLTQINSRYQFRYRNPQNYDGREFSTSYYRNYNSFKNAYLSTQDKNVLIIKLEDLVKKTKNEINKISKFLSIKTNKINLMPTMFGKPYDSRNNLYVRKKNEKYDNKFNYVYKNIEDFSCLLPNDIYIISKIKYAKHFYNLKHTGHSKSSFIMFYLRHLGFIGKKRKPIKNPWRFIKCSIYSIYLFFLDKHLKSTFLKNQNIK